MASASEALHPAGTLQETDGCGSKSGKQRPTEAEATIPVDAKGSIHRHKSVSLLSSEEQQPHLALAALRLGMECTIKVLVCRKWDAMDPAGKYISTKFILSDDLGSAIHCIAWSSIAHCFVSKLEVGHIYSFSRFTVMPNKAKYCLRKGDLYYIQLEGNTVVRQLDCDSTGFDTYPFHLTKIEDIKLNGSKYLIDVLGCAIDVGTSRPPKNGTQYVEIHLMNNRGSRIKATLWGTMCDCFLKAHGQEKHIYIALLSGMNVREFRGLIHLSSTSATAIYDTDAVSAVKQLRELMKDTNLDLLNEERSLLQTEEGTLLQLLHLGREHYAARPKQSKTLICHVKIESLRSKNSWYYFSCGLSNCKKGVTRVGGQFWYESCTRVCEFPQTRFRLHLDVSDHIATIAVTVFDELDELLVRKRAINLLEDVGDDADASVIPEQILSLINTRHVLELKTHTYYDHDSYESFTASKLISNYASLTHPVLKEKKLLADKSTLFGVANPAKESAKRKRKANCSSDEE